MLNFSIVIDHYFTAEVEIVPANAKVLRTRLDEKIDCTVATRADHDVLQDKLSLKVSTLTLVPLGATFVAHLLPTSVTLRVASVEPTLRFRNHSVAVRCAAPFHISHLGESNSPLLMTISVPF